MTKTAIVGWIITLVGTAVWIYGCYVTGHPSLIDWQTHTPWWIADFLPNVESEVGLVLVCVGMVPMYWPPQKK